MVGCSMVLVVDVVVCAWGLCGEHGMGSGFARCSPVRVGVRVIVFVVAGTAAAVRPDARDAELILWGFDASLGHEEHVLAVCF
ncbi:hypothetical protein M758_4G176500 [Ceratodon purpureus]|uniref:Secreted protein n=1 Tax=Ceratodon purpureus TaxID=3225 RepID=A0A8T0I9J4_CERPU|nr:hypothetical protein KC19_4G174100 [Ceratodon purpureus]KAG0580450.1 hypothetical protein KC19_4G174400 [Ceratodon purpureus]KAG0619928.1 hypothetical protein M758_4G176100 [Ceratodon purpureus]KAG0619933.1 hypothetical protein M758_4G176500 [Ceratodon purpureus]